MDNHGQQNSEGQYGQVWKDQEDQHSQQLQNRDSSMWQFGFNQGNWGQEYAQLALTLTENFMSIYDVDLDTGKFVLATQQRISGEKEKYPLTEDFFENNKKMVPFSVHPDDRAYVLKNLSREYLLEKLSFEPSFSFDYRVNWADGTVWYRMKVARKGSWEKERRVIIGIFDNNRDMLNELEKKKYAGIANALSEAYESIYYVNLYNNTFIEYNKQGNYATIGLEILGDDFFAESRTNAKRLVFPEDYEKVVGFLDKNHILQALAGREDLELEYRIMKKGNPVYYRMRVVQGKHDEDHIIIAVENVDVQVRARIARQEQYVQMQTISDYLIQSFTFVYYAGFHEDSVVLMYVGKNGRDRSGIPEGRVVLNGNYYSFVDYYISKFVLPEDREKIKTYLTEEYIKDRFKTEKGFTFIFRSNAYGEDRIFRTHVAKGVDEEHVAFGFMDITEETRKEQEQQRNLQEALAMAQAANRAKTTFLSSMSHDIRTPMNAIIGFTGLAASHIDNKEQVRNYLTKIAQSSDHLLSLINDVLDMSRIESGKMHIVEKNENLSDIIHTLRNIILPEINSKKMEFFVDTLDITDENIICDRLRLNQVLINTLSNAVKYTNPGGTVSLRISQKAVTGTGYATYEFRVKDNGMGMSEEFLSKIFEPFTRVSSSTVSGIQGTGLGMAITKNIVDMMGGTISITSNVGEGTEVVLVFDFKLQETHGTPEKLEELNGLRGLIVDDDYSTCLSASKMLRETGMRSEWCSSGREAVLRSEEALRNGDEFKVYIIDWIMPEMNGVETARRIRKVVGDKTPIIILTAYDWADIEEEARAAGVTGFISKPLFPSDIRRALSQCCNLETQPEEKKEEEFDFTGKKVMLVEDNEINREIAAVILEEAGFEIEEVEDGCYAVEKMKAFRPGDYDLILMDIQMPIMDGYEATRQIRSLPDREAASIPILAMTANAFEEDRQHAFEAGMNEHIPKPIDRKKMLSMLADVLFGKKEKET